MAAGYVPVQNSGSGSDCETTVYTYEAWVKRTGVGTDSGNGLVFATGGTSGSGGPGGIYYSQNGVDSGPTADTLFSNGGNTGTMMPNSAGAMSTSGYHQIVLTRADGTATGTSWYLDGVLKGTWASDAALCGSSGYMSIGAQSMAWPA